MLVAPAPVLMPQAGAHTAVSDVPSALRLLPFHLGAKGHFDAADEIDDDARLLAISGKGREGDSSGTEDGEG